MPNIYASAEVQRLIGAEALQRLRTDAYSSYQCVRCGNVGQTVQPTTVVAYRYRGGYVGAKLAHADCLASQVIREDADLPAEMDPYRTRADMRNMTLVLRYPQEPLVRPLLLLEPRTETIGPADGRDRITVAVPALLRYGLSLVAPDSQLPGVAEGWQLYRPDRHSARLVDAEGSVVYEGGCAQPDSWVRLVDAAGACVVLVGSIGLYAEFDDGLTADRIRQMLARAALAGQLTGGVVSCAHDGSAGPSPAAQPGELRRRIAQSWRGQA